MYIIDNTLHSYLYFGWLHHGPIEAIRPRLGKRRRLFKQNVSMSQNNTHTATHEEGPDEDAILSRWSDLLDSLEKLTVQDSQIAHLFNRSSVLSSLVGLNLDELKVVCKHISFGDWPEDVLADLLGTVQNTPDISYSCATFLIRSSVYLRISSLKTSMSRLIATPLSNLGQSVGKVVLDAIVLPLLKQPSLGQPQTEVIHKLITASLVPSIRIMLLRTILDPTTQSPGTLVALPWADPVLNIASALLTTVPLLSLDATLARDLIQSIRLTVQANPKDKASMQLLLVLTTKYAHCLVEGDLITSIESITAMSQMFLKRSVQAQIGSIKKKLQVVESK
ncbi:Fanconi anemia group E protein FANCE-domain-containing protein [Phycomyces blakesleeanus]